MALATLAINDLAAWVAAAVGLAALVVAYLTYRSQRGKLRFEYLLTTNTRLLPGRLADELRVSHNDTPVEGPSLSIVRMVNSGDRAIERGAFETHLIVQFEGAQRLASANWNAARPADLQPQMTIDGDLVRIEPTLLNPGDMLELQVLSAGQAREVSVSGRIANLKISRRARLPYPPGTGPEGEMEVGDKFVWAVVTPAGILSIGALTAFDPDHSLLERVLILAAAAILAGVLYPVVVRHLVLRRRLWRPY